jgi:hypothetical protein
MVRQGWIGAGDKAYNPPSAAQRMMMSAEAEAPESH